MSPSLVLTLVLVGGVVAALLVVFARAAAGPSSVTLHNNNASKLKATSSVGLPGLGQRQARDERASSNN